MAEFDFAERLVMVAGVIDIAAAAVDETVRATVACEVIDIGFVPGPLGQKSFAILEIVSTDHHAERRERIEIPFCKIAACFLLVEPFAFAFAYVVRRKTPIFANVFGDFVL